MLKKFLLFLVVLLFCGSIAVGSGFYYFVIANPGTEISLQHITAILGKESHVYYRDGNTPLGFFFDQQHRQYVEYKDIPQHFIQALIAAEDNRFFSHHGFDLPGIFRAAIKNIEAGQVVQGGSTLTQQTAKNLFERPDRSLRAKLLELLLALRLEYHYPKEKILEFYTNQFYVSGTGHGLGVAARYYFDKKPQELNLVECAYIAGSVKRPNYYNPFIKKSEADRKLALTRGQERLQYVLEKMHSLEMIDQQTLQQAQAGDIPFRQGKVGYALDYVMEMVREAVSASQVTEALEQHGISNIATAGLRVVTTVDKELQQQTLHALRHQLSLLDVTLTGYQRAAVQAMYQQLSYEGDSAVRQGAYLPGTVNAIGGGEKNSPLTVTVTLGKKLGQGFIDQAGLVDLAAAHSRWQKGGIIQNPGIKEVQNLLQQLKVGDRVWVSVRGNTDDGQALLQLEKYPEVQGGAIVMRLGQVLAMAGGVENRFFNRAVAAQRTMGSAFKPFLYTAALQLGWSSTDLLNNGRNVFVYHDQPYFPRPDHHSPYTEVSLSYAGVHSENVASIWLLAHLCDQLNDAQFRELAEQLDLAPRQQNGREESYASYTGRIRDQHGLVLNQEIIQAAAYRAALRHSSDDFIFANLHEDYRKLKNLPYGLHFEKFTENVEESTRWAGSRSAEEQQEANLRRGLLSRHYLRLRAMLESLGRYRQWLQEDLAFAVSSSASRPEGDIYLDGSSGAYYYLNNSSATASMQRLSPDEVRYMLVAMPVAAQNSFWRQLLLPGAVSVQAVEIVEEQSAIELTRLTGKRPYSFEVLADVEDFRILVGMQYLLELGKALGVQSKLEGVLSLPLGANVVTLLESTRMYEAMVTGRLQSYGNGGSEGEGLTVLDRIESESGQILYQPPRRDRQILGERARLELGHILESVVLFGTGKQAKQKVRFFTSEKSAGGESGLAVPLLGKTGTANNYTNASFFGYLPALSDSQDGLVAENGHAIGVYVGYDDNKPMRAGGIRIAGAAGALPAWIDITKSLLHSLAYEQRLDAVDLSFNGLTLQRKRIGQQILAADPARGGALAEPLRLVSETNRNQPAMLAFGKMGADGHFAPDRSFAPFWKLSSEQSAVPPGTTEGSFSLRDE